ncbi:MAG: CD0415/CD1112 family protein [Oscillospiraceae bacterium]|nr:CD0415/CD1112 family protein [Oscillospiraceae bacterium]
MGIFSLAQNVVNQSAGVISGSIDINMSMSSLETTLQSMDWGELLGLYMESAVVSLAMKALSLVIFIIIYGRMRKCTKTAYAA